MWGVIGNFGGVLCQTLDRAVCILDIPGTLGVWGSNREGQRTSLLVLVIVKRLGLGLGLELGTGDWDGDGEFGMGMGKWEWEIESTPIPSPRR